MTEVTALRCLSGAICTHAGSYRFDGYLDDSEIPPEQPEITLQPGELFPPIDSTRKPCWWVLQNEEEGRLARCVTDWQCIPFAAPPEVVQSSEADAEEADEEEENYNFDDEVDEIVEYILGVRHAKAS